MKGPAGRRPLKPAGRLGVVPIHGPHGLCTRPAAQELAALYHRARRDAAEETGLPLTTFPEQCPWPLESVLDEDWWPEDRP